MKSPGWVAIAAVSMLFSPGVIYGAAGNDAEEDSLEPEVNIIERGANRIEETRVGGRIVMIKVVPSKGYPYYLFDADGDGQLETRMNDVSDFDVVPPRWKIFEWK